MPSKSSAYEKAKKAMAMTTSVAASMMLARSLVRDLLNTGLASVRSRMTWRHTIAIEQNDGWHTNNVFYAVRTYLSSRVEAAGTTDAMKRLSRGCMDDDDAGKLVVGMEEGEEIVDVYEGVKFRWCLYTGRHNLSGDSNRSLGLGGGKLYFELTFHRKHKEKALKEYVPFIVKTAKDIREKERPLKIYLNEGCEWTTPMDLYHPSTFANVAMDHALKQSVIDDLDMFIKRKAYYQRLGKAWKRSYLLYGPPRIGKSSLIAAMANHLRFDIYDLELTGVESKSQLRKLLLGMTNRSLLVIRHMDCTTELKQQDDNKKKPRKLSNSDSGKDEKVALSRLLNFVYGLWSATGEERIIVFTTNYKEHLDRALIQPGRMDMHVHMGYCTTEAFRIFANKYHPIKINKIKNPDKIKELMLEIEELMVEVAVTHVEVAQTLMRSEKPHAALLDLLGLLKTKKEWRTKEKDKEEEEKEEDDAKDDDEENDEDE